MSNSKVESLLTRALDLPDVERLELVEALIASFESPGQPPFDDSWRDVVRHRSEEVTAGGVVPIPWPEVKRRRID